MSSSTAITCVSPRIPLARMRSIYRLEEVSRRLEKLPPKEHESLRATYERMLEKGEQRFQVKPSGLPTMDALYDELPNFHEVLDDVRRQIALCNDSSDALEITPLLLLGPPGVGKTHFARQLAELLGTGMGFVSMSSLTAGWVLSGASSQWRGARAGKVFEALVDGDYANPVMVVDEIDKAGGEAAYGRHQQRLPPAEVGAHRLGHAGARAAGQLLLQPVEPDLEEATEHAARDADHCGEQEDRERAEWQALLRHQAARVRARQRRFKGCIRARLRGRVL